MKQIVIYGKCGIGKSTTTQNLTATPSTMKISINNPIWNLPMMRQSQLLKKAREGVQEIRPQEARANV